MSIRPFEERDRARLKQITAEVFGPAAVDYYLERRFGLIRQHDWRWRKVRHVDDDIRTDLGGIFVYDDSEAEGADYLLGYVTIVLDRDAGIGRIANLAVTATAQGRGIGRALLDYALTHIAKHNMVLARIETLAGSGVGEHLYPAMGFEEVARQIYYAKRVREEPLVRQLLYIVSREQPQLFERLRQEFAKVSHVEVVIDRRVAERRQSESATSLERRRAERRQREIQADLAQLGCVLIPRAS